MTDSKLTLKLNTESISRAKSYSVMHGISVSSMVEKFFDGLTLEETVSKYGPVKFSPLVNELSGIISVSNDYDYKKEYLEHLEHKYS